MNSKFIGYVAVGNRQANENVVVVRTATPEKNIKQV
jgi:hypothetical protein